MDTQDTKIYYSVVVPVFNEQEVIEEFYKRLASVMAKLGEYEIIFVNDGSKDRSLQIIKQLQNENSRIKILDFSRNFGHQVAITAGMDYSKGRAVIIIDADLQDPPEVIPDFIDKWKQGYEIIYGVRKERQGESIFKKLSAKIFYRILKTMTSVDIPVDAGDFRLMDRKVVDVFKNEIRERNRYIRGLTSWVGFRQIGVLYDREKRFAGKTKYPLRKMIKLALDGIISFSTVPLKLVSYFGFLTAGGSFLYAIYALVMRIFTNKTMPGWTSLVLAIVFLGGIQLLSLGVIGEYISRINDESKKRP
ncbi:glycosyltransferase family 2 protein, partial [Patescibacteria group bacterium]|nr:glycosyltransferase family 2 protein [Patescibacteria group bacterium]